ncbi:MAG TPA: CpaF family protein [Isosphaeraceae bacterium]
MDSDRDAAAPAREQAFQRHKARIHQELVEAIDLSRIDGIDRGQLRAELRGMAEALGRARPAGPSLDPADRDRLVEELMHEFYGLGPLEPLLRDPAVTDVLVNGPDEVYVERAGRLERTGVVFADEAHLLRIIQRAVARTGRRIDESSAMVDARLPDGARLNAVVAPVAVGGPLLSIRRGGPEPLRIEDLIADGALAPEMAALLHAAVAGRLNLLIAGGTGSGKTTLLGALSASIGPGERVVLIEETAELRLLNRHVTRMEARPPNAEGTGHVTPRDLVRNALRMRPDRILVGEVRGPEAFDMLQAMNTGHEGSLSTIHANDGLDALLRLEMMVALTGLELPQAVVRQYIAMGLRLVVHLMRLPGGARRIRRVAELAGLADGQYVLRDLFTFEPTGIDASGRPRGRFLATGHRPSFLDRLRLAGHPLDDGLFAARELVVPAAGGSSYESGDPRETGAAPREGAGMRAAWQAPETKPSPEPQYR